MKKFLVYTLIFVISLSTIACTGNKKNDNVTTTKNELQGNVVVWSSGTAAKALTDAAIMFSKQYPKVSVQVKEVKDNENISSSLSSGVNMPDIFTIEGNQVQAIASKFSDKLLDLSQDMSSVKGKYVKSKLSEIMVNKKIYAYPWTSEPVMIFYRQDLFKAAGINADDIKTWNQYIDTGKTIAAYTKTDTRLIAVNGIEYFYNILLSQLGSGYFSSDDKPILNSKESNKAVTLMKTFKDSNLIYSYSNLDSLISGIKSGKVVALPMNIEFAKTLRDRCSELNGKWAVMELPAFEFGGKTAASTGGTDIMVTNEAKDNKAAQEFARYAARNTNPLSNMFIKEGLLSCYIPFYSEIIFDNKVNYFNGQKAWKIFAKVSKDVKEINYTNNYLETQQSVKEALVKIIDQNQDLKTTLDDLEKNTETKYSK